MGDILPIAMLIAIILLTGVVLTLSLLLVRKSKAAQTADIPDITNIQALDKAAADKDTSEEINRQLLLRLNELEHRLSLVQNENAGVLNRQISALNTRIGAVDENMQHLQRLFRNVKLRGGWGEVQLAAILAEILSPAQYAANVAVDPESTERVEFAVKLPLPDNTHLWLPIDSKCPIEDFERWQTAAEQANREEAEKCARALDRRLMEECRDIAEKYIRPPYSTDFALLFLPMESLYQWVISRPSLVAEMEQKRRVVPCGPTTLLAVLNLVQLSHRTMAIGQSEGEVWRYLGNVKQEMSNFDEAITKSQKKAAEMTSNLDNLARRLRVLERRLAELEKLSQTQ